MPIGSRGHLGLGKETEWGTPITATKYLMMLSESITQNIEQLLSAAQRGIVDEPLSLAGLKTFGGDIVMDVHPANFGHILRSAIDVPSGGNWADADILTLEDCEDAWGEAGHINTGVISGLDANDKKKGSNAVKLIVSDGVGAGEILATEQVTSTDMKADTALKVWVKCNKACDPGHLQFMLGKDAGCATDPKFANIPALEADVWKECDIPLGYMSRSDIEFIDGGEADDTITTVAGDFEAAGFIIGDKVTVTGTDNNNRQYLLKEVAAKTLTIETGSDIQAEPEGAAILNAMADYNAILSVGIKMVTDKAECIIRIDDMRRLGAYTADVAKKWIFTPRNDDFHDDCPLNPYTIEVHRDQDETKAFQYKGAVVNTLELSFGVGDKILKATAGIIAKDVAQIEKTSLAFEKTIPFVWKDATIKTGAGGTVPATGATNGLESFGISIDNHLVGIPALNADDKIKRIYRDAAREVNVNFVIDFIDQTQYGYFVAGDERAFQIKFVGAAVPNDGASSKYTLQIDLPLVRYTVYPPYNISGPGRITAAVSGKAKYDTTLLYAILFTLINKETAY